MTDALEEPTRPVSLGFQILLGLANAGAIMALMPVLNILIPAQVTSIDPEHSATSLAWVLSLGALGALVGNPLAGALSDRTTSRLGRRRPWLLMGMLATTGGLALLARSQTILMLAVGWMLVQFFGNVLLAAYNAIVPDRVPAHQRGTTQAIIGFASPLGMILSTYYLGRVQNLGAGYWPIMGALVALTAAFVALYREPRLLPGTLPPFRWRAFLASVWLNPRQQPNLSLAWLMWFLIWTGYSLGSGGFVFLYLQNVTQYSRLFPGHAVKEGIATLQMLQIACGVPAMLLAGWLSDRLGRRKIFVALGALLMAAGLTSLACSSSWPVVLAAGTSVGVGFWFFYSLGLATLSQILPSASSRGKDLGVINVAATLPQVIIPGIGAAVLNTLGIASALAYSCLFLTGAVFILAGACLLRFIRGVR